MPRTSAASSTRQAGEEAQLDQLGGLDGSSSCEPFAAPRRGRAGPPRFGVRQAIGVVELDSLPTATVLRPSLPAGVLDQDPSHRLGRGGEEVAPAVPVLAHLATRPGAGTPRGPGPWPGGSGRASRGPASARPAGAARRRPGGAVARPPGGRPARSPRGSGSLRSWRTVVPGHPLAPRSRPTPKRHCPGSARQDRPEGGRPSFRINPEAKT